MFRQIRTAKQWAKIKAKLDALDARVSAIIGRAQQPRKSRTMQLLDADRAPALPARVFEYTLPAPSSHVVQDRRGTRHGPPLKHNRRVKIFAIDDDHVERRLAQLLDRACSRRTGYDGDDVVEYGKK